MQQLCAGGHDTQTIRRRLIWFLNLEWKRKVDQSDQYADHMPVRWTREHPGASYVFSEANVLAQQADVPSQGNLTDCGLHVLANMDALLTIISPQPQVQLVKDRDWVGEWVLSQPD